ncbi:MAG: phytanoyl-CoA dioxygenase family protein [Planctomycetes bacterium]|nr:phytanoyl-CoA dioxygenase family protein [Planctomycetota bacterium]
MSSGDIAALVRRYDEQGFVLLECLLSGRQTEAVQKAVEWAFSQPHERFRWIRQRTYEWFDRQPIFVELIEHPQVAEFARDVLGPEFHLIAAQCSRNTRGDPYAPGAFKIHQDGVFFPRPERQEEGVPDYRYGFSAMWYVQDTPLAMGPTELIPGSHRGGRKYDDEEAGPLVLRREIPAGSLLIFNHRTWHRGARNETDTPRDLVTNAYARPEVGKVQLMSPKPGGGEAYVPCEVLLRTASPLTRQLLS